METYPTLPWAGVERELKRNWNQGEHVFLNGPTGVGKTTAISRILPRRKYTVILVTKVFDDTISNEFPNYERIYEWPPRFTQNKVLLWPKAGKTIRQTKAIQRYVFGNALDKIFLERNWTVVFDEQHYVCKDLGLEQENTMFQHQARSSGITLVNGAQRPAWIPLITLSGSTHNFLWKNTTEEDLKRMSNIGGIDRKELTYNMLMLDKHSFVYVNSRSGMSVVSNVER